MASWSVLLRTFHTGTVPRTFDHCWSPESVTGS